MSLWKIAAAVDQELRDCQHKLNLVNQEIATLCDVWPVLPTIVWLDKKVVTGPYLMLRFPKHNGQYIVSRPVVYIKRRDESMSLRKFRDTERYIQLLEKKRELLEWIDCTTQFIQKLEHQLKQKPDLSALLGGTRE